MEKKYLRMLKGMAEAPGMPLDWSVYVVRCGDGSLYTGIAKDVADRIERHNAGKGAAYTRSRRPVLLLYSETGLTRSQALVREARIKSLPRNKKESLVLNNGDAADRARTRA